MWETLLDNLWLVGSAVFGGITVVLGFVLSKTRKYNADLSAALEASVLRAQNERIQEQRALLEAKEAALLRTKAERERIEHEIADTIKSQTLADTLNAMSDNATERGGADSKEPPT